MSQDLVNPSLLDKLSERTEDDAETSFPVTTDDDYGTGISLEEYKRTLSRDLERMINTRIVWPSQAVRESFRKLAPGEERKLKDFPHVISSVICCGVPDPAGRLHSSADAHALSQRIKEAILRFEPRLDPHTLNVDLDTSTKPADEDWHILRPLRFIIRGEIRVQEPSELIEFSLEAEPVSESLKVRWTPNS